MAQVTASNIRIHRRANCAIGGAGRNKTLENLHGLQADFIIHSGESFALGRTLLRGD